MKKIATLMLTVALIAGGSVAAVAKPYNERNDQGPAAGVYRHGYNGYQHRGYDRPGWQHHRGYYRHGRYYSYYDDDGGDNAWAGVLPGVVFGTILGSALSR